MRRVVIESPYRARWFWQRWANKRYLRRCLRHALLLDESPVASHATLAWFGALDDACQNERALGISAGHLWIAVADAVVVYTDRGISDGMKAGIRAAEVRNIPVEYRSLYGRVEPKRWIFGDDGGVRSVTMAGFGKRHQV